MNIKKLVLVNLSIFLIVGTFLFAVIELGATIETDWKSTLFECFGISGVLVILLNVMILVGSRNKKGSD